MGVSFSEEYIARLRRLFGLNLYETKVWLALLTQGKSSTARIGEIADIPKSRAYDVLESLEASGFATRQLGKPITYKAVPPDELIDKLKEKAEEELHMKLEKYEKLRDSETMKDLHELYMKGLNYVKEDEVATSYQGAESIYFRIKKRIATSKEEVIIVSTSTAIMNMIRMLNRILKHIKSNKVSIKIYVPQGLKQEVVDELSKIGKVYNLDMELGRFIIIDNDTVFLFTQDDKEVHPSNEIVINLTGGYMPAKLKELVNVHTAK